MGDPLVSIIIPTFNSMRYIERCLSSVRAAMMDYGNAELILVDNGSTDGTYEYLISNHGQGARIFQIKDATISTLRNHGARAAEGQFLSFVDSDCVIPRDYFRRATVLFKTIKTDAAGNYYDLPPNSGWVQDTWYNLNRRPTNRFVPYLFAGNFIVKREAFDLVGGFDENLATGEDAELGLRMNKAGLKIYATSEIPALHLGIRRNVAEFFRKHAWHGLGMFGSARITWLDKPLLMTFMYIIATFGGLVNLLNASMAVAERIFVATLLTLFVPIAAVIYRTFKRRQIYRPLPAIILYYVFFFARTYALFLILTRKCSQLIGFRAAAF